MAGPGRLLGWAAEDGVLEGFGLTLAAGAGRGGVVVPRRVGAEVALSRSHLVEKTKSMGGALYKEKCVHQANYKTEFFRGPPSGNMTALTTHTGRPFRHRTSTPSVPFGPRRRTSLVALTKFFVAPYFLVSLRVC